jgi:hypothetical protein
MALLCACASPDRWNARSKECLGAGPVDWPRFLALATNHHVIPLVHRALKAVAKKDPTAIPVELLSYIHREYMAIAAHNLRATVLLHRLQGLMEANGIPLVPIKGPALAMLAYGSTSLRQFEDLDLIAEQADLLRAVDLLEQDGYVIREIPPAADRNRYLMSWQDWSLRKPGEALHLDLKPVLISHALCGPPSAGFMAQACRTISTGEGQRLLAPGPEAMLLAVCVDGANEMWPKLSSIADVGALLTAFPGADWNGLLREAAGFGQKRSLLVGAQVAEAVLGCSLPEAFREEASKDPPARRFAGEAAGQMLAGESLRAGILRQSRFTFQTRDRGYGRRRYLSRLLFVPGAMDLIRFPLPKALYPLYFCIRPFRLAWTVCHGSARRIPLTNQKSNP